MNNKGSAGIWVILGVVVLLAFIIWGSYNGLVTKDANVENSWAKVQTAYERRADLIPNLVETVKGYSSFEQETQTKIAQYRAGIRDATTPEQLDAIGAEMTKMVSGIAISVEAYPDLKASENFLSLQDELAGTENRIKWERDNYNDAVNVYKISTKKFPTNIIANQFGFNSDKYDMFQAEVGSEDAPKVSFK